MTKAKIVVDEKEAGTRIFEVWKTYEEVAMHFNDLLLKLRIQALAGVAALAVLAGIFSNVRTFNFQGTWIIAAACFFGLILIWSAIWALDQLYYNRLLLGSVAAIPRIEELSKTQTHVTELDLSTHIEEAVSGQALRPVPQLRGVTAFYVIVFVTLFVGFGVTTYSALNYPPREAAELGGMPGATTHSPAASSQAPPWSPLRRPPR
jgi:hypothetical protein